MQAWMWKKKESFSFLLFLFLLSLVYVAATDETRPYQTLEKWYMKKNPTFQKLRLGKERDEQQLKPGVYAAEHIKKGEKIIIPRKHLISLRDFIGTDIGDIFYLVDLQFGRDLLFDPADYLNLALVVWHERFSNPDSEWKYWFDSLPEPGEMNNILFFSSEEMQELKGTPLWDRAVGRRQEVLDAFKWMQANLFGSYERAFPRVPTLQEFRWAVSIVRTRNIHSKRFNKPMLTPIFDLFRHVPYADDMLASWELTEDDKVIITINQDVEPGTEIKLTFGEICNSELLDFHGFIIPNNSDDCVNLFPQVPEDDPLITVKSFLFKKLNAGPKEVKIAAKGITTHLLLINRILSVQDPNAFGGEELMYGIDPNFSDWPIGIDILAFEEVVKQCREIYSNYPTTKEVRNVFLL